MIVNYTESGWQIITQPNHGLLAAQLLSQWKIAKRPERWMEILIATACHDDVYTEFHDEGLLNANGGPVDFKMNGFRLDYAEQLINLASTKSAFTALLIASHLHFLFKQDTEASNFLSALKQTEQAWLKASGASKKEVKTAYALLQFCDAFSLLLCQGLIPPENRKAEISKGPDGTLYTMACTADQQISVSDWPFQDDEFTVFWESRTLSQLSFQDVNAFRSALRNAEIVRHELKVKNTAI